MYMNFQLSHNKIRETNLQHQIDIKHCVIPVKFLDNLDNLDILDILIYTVFKQHDIMRSQYVKKTYKRS